jgi:RimJ/RimL family protein N-acetyltransferase
MAPADWSAYAALMASPRAAFMGGPFDTRAAWGLFCHDAAGWALFGAGALMADRRDSGATVGQVGINNGPLFPEARTRLVPVRRPRRAGLRHRSGARPARLGLRTGGLTRLVSYMDPANHASAAVALRLGAVPDPDAQRQPGPENDDDLVFRHSPGGRA